MAGAVDIVANVGSPPILNVNITSYNDSIANAMAKTISRIWKTEKIK